MKKLDYSQALLLARELSDKLSDSRALKKHCEDHNLNLHNVYAYIRNDHVKKVPKLILDLLKSLGYKVEIEKKVIYSFILDTDPAKEIEIGEMLHRDDNSDNEDLNF